MPEIPNRELARNQTWTAAMTWLECHFCNYLSQDLNLANVDEPCPRCGNGGHPRLIFPGIMCNRLVELILHYYANSHERYDERVAALERAISHQLGREFNPQILVEAAFAVRSIRNKSDNKDDVLVTLLGTIQERLGLHSASDARKVLVPLLQYSDTNEDHQITLLLTASLLEQLFKELLLRTLVRLLADWESSRKIVKALRDHGAREKEFAKLAGFSLNEMTTSLGFSTFYADWRSIRKLRNTFVHGIPFIIDRLDAEKAFELAKNSFRVFALVLNHLWFPVSQPVNH